MSIKTTLSTDGLEEVYSVPTLKELCLYKCLQNKDILTKQVAEGEDGTRRNGLEWEKYRLKEPIQPDLVEALLETGSEFMFKLTPEYGAVLAGIRMSQPQHLVKLNLSNSDRLQDDQLEWLLSGGNVKWLDLHGCSSLRGWALDTINKYGKTLEYLRIGYCYDVLPMCMALCGEPGILKTPNLKTFIISDLCCHHTEVTMYCEYLLHDFISNLEDLQIRNMMHFESLVFLEAAKDNLNSLSLVNCKVLQNGNAWASIFKLNKLKSLELIGTKFEEDLDYQGNIVQRILSSMPNLVNLVVDPGLFKRTFPDKLTKAGGSVAKRLDIFGVLDKDLDDIVKARLLSATVISFGSAQDELQLLEYFSNRFNLSYFEPTLGKLLTKINSDSISWQSVTVVGFIIKIFKNNGVGIVHPEVFLSMMWNILTANVGRKCGAVLKEQCQAILLSSMRGLAIVRDYELPSIVIKIIYMLKYLDAELPFEQCTIAVSSVANITKNAILYRSERHDTLERIIWLLKTTACLLKMAVNRFGGENHECWGMSSVLYIVNQFPEMMKGATKETDRNALFEYLSCFIESLRQLCESSAYRRQVFQFCGGVNILLGILEEIYGGALQLAKPLNGIFLATLKSIFQDNALDYLDSSEIASRLRRLAQLISNT